METLVWIGQLRIHTSTCILQKIIQEKDWVNITIVGILMIGLMELGAIPLILILDGNFVILLSKTHHNLVIEKNFTEEIWPSQENLLIAKNGLTKNPTSIPELPKNFQIRVLVTIIIAEIQIMR